MYVYNLITINFVYYNTYHYVCIHIFVNAIKSTLIQFDNGVLYNYKTSFETFFKLTQSHSIIFEVTPGLLVNLDKLQNIIPNDEEDEFVCNLVSQKNIEISKSQKESLIAHIENYS